MLDPGQLDALCQAIDNAAAWIAFYFIMLMLCLMPICAFFLVLLATRRLWLAVVRKTWNRAVVCLERKALRP